MQAGGHADSVHRSKSEPAPVCLELGEGFLESPLFIADIDTIGRDTVLATVVRELRWERLQSHAGATVL